MQWYLWACRRKRIRRESSNLDGILEIEYLNDGGKFVDSSLHLISIRDESFWNMFPFENRMRHIRQAVEVVNFLPFMSAIVALRLMEIDKHTHGCFEIQSQ